MGKKQEVLTALFNICEKSGDYKFHNKLVKELCLQIGFGNPFEVTKIDSRKILPEFLQENDVGVLHLGKGYHQFVKGLDLLFYEFEPVQTEIDWQYRRSLLNEYNTSEANALSVANNQRILHHFVFGEDLEFENLEISQRPKTYFPHRTKANLIYQVGETTQLELESVQIEIDLTIEFRGLIVVFEAKNGNPKNFSVYQLYHPFLYYYNAKQKPEMNDKIKEIVCIYMTKQKIKGVTKLRFWKYVFENPNSISSIKLLQSVCYNLIEVER